MAERLTINEAIAHAREVAEKNRTNCNPNTIIMPNRWISNIDCAEEYEQLAKWLKELKHYKDLEEQGRLITLPCAVGSLVWEIGIFDTGEEAGLFRAKPFALSDMEWDRLGNTVFLTLDEAIQKWKEIDTFGGFAEEIANVEAALKGAENGRTSKSNQANL